MSPFKPEHNGAVLNEIRQELQYSKSAGTLKKIIAITKFVIFTIVSELRPVKLFIKHFAWQKMETHVVQTLCLPGFMTLKIETCRDQFEFN